jgi:FtsP/CotA-like multicopper oxidase with cupredoxin domain
MPASLLWFHDHAFGATRLNVFAGLAGAYIVRDHNLGLAAPMWQIGAEGGLWDEPVSVKKLVLAPAERADVIADFSGLSGQSLILTNTCPRAPISTPTRHCRS